MSHFQIGWAEYSLTPDKKVSLVGQFAERISEYVEKPLCVTAMAVSTDSDQAVFCSCDLVGVSWSLRDAVIFLRCNDRFAEDTLTVRIATVTPDSLRFGEWFLLVIPHPKGPAALMREAAIPYRRRIRLTQHGDYRCSVTPVRPVRGVEAVGVDLQQSR